MTLLLLMKMTIFHSDVSRYYEMGHDVFTIAEENLERIICQGIKLKSLEDCEVLPFDVLGHVVQDVVNNVTREYRDSTNDAFFLKVRNLFVDKPFFMHFKLSANSVGHQFASHVQTCIGSNAVVDLTQPFALELYRLLD